MPQAAAMAATDRSVELMTEMLLAALRCVAEDRKEALRRKWLPRDSDPSLHQLPESRVAGMFTDAVSLTCDLLVSQPNWTGSTAIDRLAKSRVNATQAEKMALAGLRQARFRLLRFEEVGRGAEVKARDVLSNEVLRLVLPEMPRLPAGTALFGRVAALSDGRFCIPGAITPLDHIAFDVAHGAAPAGNGGLSADSRWAEAVYRHVVRHGTMEVPGLNRPPEDEPAPLPSGGPLFDLFMEWAALEGRAADDAILQRTRRLINEQTMFEAVAGLVLCREVGDSRVAGAIERLLLVQMETLHLRERTGRHGLTLDGIAAMFADGTGPVGLSPKLRDAFAALRQRLPAAASARVAGDPALERLLQRIQALRAKTVEHGCTEQEALAAAAKVAELLDRHGLSLGELDFRAQPCDGIGIQTTRRRMAPIDGCISAIAAFFDCRVWLEQAKGAPIRYVFFGLRGDVTAAQYLYEMVDRAFDTETDAFRAGDIYARMEGERRSATNSFQIGLADGIVAKLKIMRATRDATLRSASGRDLVPVKAAMVDEEMARLGLDFHARGTTRKREVLSDAYHAGEEAGQRFEVTPGITRAA
jgi:hypothetical protein